MSLMGKVALVTGSTSGIGLGIARALAEAGADIMLNGFGDPAQIDIIRDELVQTGRRVGYHDADLSKADQVALLVQNTVETLGAVDILVNNAGIQHTATIANFPDDKWDQVIAINLSAAFHAMKASIPLMTEAGWGRIINIASAHGLVGSREKSAYVAAKHGLIGLTKVGAIEVANAGITVNAICPGWVLTPLVQAQIDARAKAGGLSSDEMARSMVAEKQAMHAFSTPESIGGMAVYLCSDLARTVTGASLSIDGGWVAQ